MEIRITPQEIVVLSFPGPDRSIRMEDLRSGKAISRRYRNRRIGEFLKELELTEGRSTGIPKIIRAIQNNGSPQPVFETDDDHSYFLVRFPIHPRAMKALMNDQPPQVTPQVTPQVMKLILSIQDEMDRDTLQTVVGLVNRKYFREQYLLPAIQMGFIEMTIPDKPNSRFQKYRLTPAGMQYREQATK